MMAGNFFPGQASQTVANMFGQPPLVRHPFPASSDAMASPRHMLTHLDGVVSEMERALSGAQQGSLPGSQESAVTEKRFALLAEELSEIHALTDHHAKANAGYRERITELEELNAELKHNEAASARESAAQNKRAMELERNLGITIAEREKLQQSHDLQKERIAEMQKLLLESKDREEELYIRTDDLERQLAATEAKLNADRALFDDKSADLNYQLGNACTAQAEHVSRHEADQRRLKELEQALSDAEQQHENLRRQQTAHVVRIAELDEIISELKGREQNFDLREQSWRNKVEALEGRLQDADAVEERFRSIEKERRKQVSNLEDEIEEVRQREADKIRELQSAKSEAARLERQMSKNRESSLDLEEQLRRQSATSRDAASLEAELERLQASEAAYRKQTDEDRARLTELSAELELFHQEKDQYRSRLDDKTREIAELSQALEDAQVVLDKERKVLSAAKAEWEEKLQQKQEAIDQLESQQEALNQGLRRQNGQDLTTLKSSMNERRYSESSQRSSLISISRDSPRRSLLVGKSFADEEEIQPKQHMNARQLEANPYGLPSVPLNSAETRRPSLTAREFHTIEDAPAIPTVVPQDTGGQVALPRASIDALPAPYQEVLLQIQNSGWDSVTWKRGYTMLHWAAKESDEEMIKHLVALRGDPGSVDEKGRSPADIAAKNGRSDVARLLTTMASSNYTVHSKHGSFTAAEGVTHIRHH